MTTLLNVFEQMKGLLPSIVPVIVAWLVALACAVTCIYVTLKLLLKREFQVALCLLKMAGNRVLKELIEGAEVAPPI